MLKTFAPKSPVLKKYIDTFYVFNSDIPGNLGYLAFPHTNTGLSFFRGVSINRGNFRVKICEQQTNDNSVCIEILGKYTQPVFVNYEGLIDEIAVIFKPLGINRFIDDDLLKIAGNYTQPFNNELWLQKAKSLFDSDTRNEDLEQFLLSVFKEKDEFQKIEQSLAMFENSMEDYSVSEVAEKLCMNLKTFQRSFTKITACSPSDYKRIARFRNSLRSKFQSKEMKSLTSITYESNYSDQSYFIREFRKMTNQNPKHFFKEASLVDGDKIVWEIL